MDVRILGPLEVLDEGRALALGQGKQRALFALLLLHANETLARDRLIDELWGDRPPATAVKSIQIYVSRLRKAFAAEQHFEAALAANARMGARPWLAHTQSDYAQMLRARNRPGDRDGAETLIDAARATYRELGISPRSKT